MKITNKPNNINTYEYWENRYKTDWESCNGREQTTIFMQDLIINLPLEVKDDIKNKNIVDMSCAFGEGVNVLGNEFPEAIVNGVDFSDEALKQCRKKYYQYKFYKNLTKKYNCLITSNTLEHFDYPIDVLKEYCNYSDKYIIILVPYNQQIEENTEHVYSFIEDSFPKKINGFKKIFTKIFYSEGWLGDQLITIYKR